MSLLDFVLRGISQSGFRSVVIFLFAFIVAGSALATSLILRGGEASLQLGRERLGADVMVVPAGASGRVEGALLSGKPTSVWMSSDNVQRIQNVAGVEAVSPQLFLASLANASCCSASELFMIAIDPTTDFTIRPWTSGRQNGGLGLGEGLGGSLVFVPEGDDYIRLYGYFVTLKGNLEPTGSGLDQTLFITLDTAHEMARLSRSRAEQPLEIPSGAISAAMVRVKPGADPSQVAREIQATVPGVSAVASPSLFVSAREQLASLRRGVTAILGLALLLALGLIALVSAIAVGERRRQIGVLRALGATRWAVFQSVIGEALLLAAAGGVLGVLLLGSATYLFHNLIAAALGITFVLPSADGFLLMVGAGLALALGAVALATFGPALRVSLREPALTMRE